jgi:hypothetical protein
VTATFTPDPDSLFERTPQTTAVVDHKEPIEVWVYDGPRQYTPARRPVIEVMYRDDCVVLYRSAQHYNYALNKRGRAHYECYNTVGPKKFKKVVKGYVLQGTEQ